MSENITLNTHPLTALRNEFVLSVIKTRPSTAKTLDVGCGAGELVCAISRLGIESTGVDFAAQMIAKAHTTAKAEKLSKAHFICRSIFDVELSKPAYDLVSANGFTDYITFGELEHFASLAYRALHKGGSLILGIRNRLFNLVSMNSFTLQEMESGAYQYLFKEAVAIASGADLYELAELHFEPFPENETELARGKNVESRRQYTPAQIIHLLTTNQFLVKQLYPVDINGTVQLFKNNHPDVHAHISSLLQEYASTNMSLIPYASSFMIHAVK
jgi:SAM-dependent methyltransferase